MATTVQHDLLVERFLRLTETGHDPDDILAEDVFCDVNVPQWRFQIQGREPVCGWVAGQTGLGVEATAERVIPMPDGFVVDGHCNIRTPEGDVYCRSLYVARVTNGRITDLIVYCTGAWDTQTRERHAREAPMLTR